MRIWGAVFCLAWAGSSSAATLNSPDVFGATSGSVFNVTLNMIQQWNVPITFNQAVAIGINSNNTVAVAETAVHSVNEVSTFTLNLSSLLSQHEMGPFLTALLDPQRVELPRTTSLPAGFGARNPTPAPVPLPAALPMVLTALAGLGWVARRRKGAAAVRPTTGGPRHRDR